MATNIDVSIRYSSHLPVLVECMNRTKGDVLELGPGVFSTPILHWLCETKRRNLLTIETDPKWFRFCSKYYRTAYHKFLHVKHWDDAKEAISKPWDVVLIDHSPSARRVTEIATLADKAKYIVIHDTEDWKDYEYHYSTIYPLFKYRYNFRDADHNTSLVSNLVNLDDFTVYESAEEVRV